MIVADHGYITEFDYPVTVQCIVREAERQKLEPELVWAILRKENGLVGKHSLNTNKTVDIGPMQINNGKFEKYLWDLQKETNFTLPQFKKLLYGNACFNVSVGAYVLRQKINAAKGNMFKGGGWYHSANEPYYSRYRRDLESKYHELKRSPVIQKQLSDARANLYAAEYKIKPIKKVKAKKVSNVNQSYINHQPYGIQPNWLKPSYGQTSTKLHLRY